MKDMHKIVALCVKYLREIPTYFLIAPTAILGLTLFLPEHLAKALALAEFRAEYRVFIGPAFWLAFSLLVGRLFSICRQQCRRKQALKAAQKSLHHLTPEEEGHLAVYVLGEETIRYVSIEDKVMRGLAMRGIIRHAARRSFLLEGVAYSLQPWAREYLEKNPHLLEDYAFARDPNELTHL